MAADAPLTEELAASAALENPEAFAALVARVRGRLDTWIALRLGARLRGRIAEEDVLQETLLQAYRGLGSFRDTGRGSFRRWLLSVAENRIRDMRKFHAAQKRDLGREIAQPRTPDEASLLDRVSVGGASPPSMVHARDARRELVERIDALPDDLRTIVVARALEERPFREIAEQQGLAITTVQARFARGLRELRGMLDG